MVSLAWFIPLSTQKTIRLTSLRTVDTLKSSFWDSQIATHKRIRLLWTTLVDLTYKPLRREQKKLDVIGQYWPCTLDRKVTRPHEDSIYRTGTLAKRVQDWLAVLLLKEQVVRSLSMEVRASIMQSFAVLAMKRYRIVFFLSRICIRLLSTMRRSRLWNVWEYPRGDTRGLKVYSNP